ncbi:MAG: metal transporter [Thermodesulfobacteriota bacterium]
MFGPFPSTLDNLFQKTLIAARSAWDAARTGPTYGVGMSAYLTDFLNPFLISLGSFLSVERDKAVRRPPWETARDYLELLRFNLQIAEKGYLSSLDHMGRFYGEECIRQVSAWLHTLFGRPGEGLPEFLVRHAQVLDQVVYEYPAAIRAIKSEYGLHPENGGFPVAAETDRFILYQVLPTEPGVEVNPSGKPIIIIPPYVLGPNILCFLPGERKSYVHAYANQGLPTYIRVMKDIAECEAVQVITGEDDALDTAYFCRLVKERHGRPVTLNGFCQGGFITLLDLLTGELDGLVDALITCVAPMDGSRSLDLVEYLRHLPPRFRDLGYAVKTARSGRRIVDGKVMSWVYKLKSMEKEAPLVTFFRDLMLFQARDGQARLEIGKTAAALNHWLIYDRTDLPEEITKLSFASYTVPIAPDGTLPVKLFGRALNLKALAGKGLRWLICLAEKDDLVDAASALAPLDWVPAEVTVFPKGHGAIATSWSHPESKCALQTRFGRYRGPVRFQLDLQAER